MIVVQSFTFNLFEEKTFVVWDETGEGVIIDPGCHAQSERDKLIRFIEEKKITLRFLLNTHGHIDHIVGNEFVKKQWNLPFIAHKFIVKEIEKAKEYGHLYEMALSNPPFPDEYADAGSKILFGNTVFDVLYTPGHALSHISFYEAASKSLFSGDVLFQMGIGRWDLPGGNVEVLLESIRAQLLPLPPETVVYCGHGDTTTIGLEKRMNPYINGYYSV